MPYIQRNERGDIVALLDSPNAGSSEWLDVDNSDVLVFLQQAEEAHQLKESLGTSDAEIARVLEDVIDILMEKQVFVFTELPEAAQEKLNKRKQLRDNVNALSNLISDDDNIL